MPLTHPCTFLIAEAVDQAQSLLKSDAGRILLASLALAKTVLYYLSQYRLPQSRELAAAVLVGIMLAVLVTASESEVPKLVMAGIKCNSLEAGKYATQIALRKAQQTPPS